MDSDSAGAAWLFPAGYKIFMDVLERRVQGVITYIVGPHQTSGIRARSIFTNINVAISIFECCDALPCRVGMIQLDLYKAVHRFVHEIIIHILEHVNDGSAIIDLKRSYI